MPSPSADATDVVVAHPVTGELLDALEAQPPTVLADALLALRERQQQLRAMERSVEAELRRRLAGRERTIIVFGDFEVQARPAARREWDADELEVALRELLDRGAVDARDLTDVIRHETTVSGREALRLMGRLSGQAQHDVERCFRWVQKGPPKVEVARSVQLQPPEDGPDVNH
jgi:hypothetical protein